MNSQPSSCAEIDAVATAISTYQLIAAHLGKQNGARAVGNAYKVKVRV